MKNNAQDALNSIKDGIVAKKDIETLQILIDEYQEALDKIEFLNEENKEMLIENHILLERIKHLEEM